ncbi:MAG TPA: dihydrofolate reductase family protein [Patescibacteria group bacterium]|nr:dihydrofolate reductase family protein [Patescibacteria group bacterium]
MRKIIVVEFLTMDGVIQAPGASKEDASEGFKYGGWMGPFFGTDEVAGQEMQKQMSQTSALLLGRKTYDIFAGFWPHHATEAEGWPQVNKITKYVVSKTLENPSWENTEVIKDIEELKKLKNSDGPDLQVYGSANLIQSLMKHDLVDEFWLKIFPLTLGSGKKLFQDGTMPFSFKLFDSKVTPNGIIFAYYRRDGEIKVEDIV